MLIDYHTHTNYSDDSIYEMEQCVIDAIEKGLKELCFTDHVDYGIKVDWDWGVEIEYRNGDPIANVDYPKYYQEYLYLKEKYKDDITLKFGLEFGMQTHTIELYEKLFQKYPFDFIILSCHQVEDKEFWTQDFQKGRTQKEYNERYYQEIYELVQKYKNYSILGHLDLLSRYDLQGYYPFENIKDILTKILKVVIEDGKGIEVNTSYVRYQLKDTTPSKDILKLYKELGGTIITIGSDSHKKDHLGSYIKEAKEMLMELGFENYCTYEKMQPIFHPLKDDE